MKHTIVDEVRYDIYRRVLAACFENPKCPDPQSAIGTAGMVTGLAVEDLIKAGVIKAERDYVQEVMDEVDQSSVADQIRHLGFSEDRRRIEFREPTLNQSTVPTHNARMGESEEIVIHKDGTMTPPDAERFISGLASIRRG